MRKLHDILVLGVTDMCTPAVLFLGYRFTHTNTTTDNSVGDSRTLVIDIEGEPVLASVSVKGEGSMSATLQFGGPDRSIPHRRCVLAVFSSVLSSCHCWFVS